MYYKENIFDTLTTTTDECADIPGHKEGTPCSSSQTIGVITEFIKSVDATKKNLDDNNTTISIASDILKCDSEACVLTNPIFRKYVVNTDPTKLSNIDDELETRFKTEGPRDTNAWLSNINIDKTLAKWTRTFPGFYACPFAMMDFETNGNMFAKIFMPDVHQGKQKMVISKHPHVEQQFNTFGCILNTDKSTGKGKHWVAIFVDMRKKPWTVEYFNSAGRPPPASVIRWMEKVKSDLYNYCKCDVKIVAVTDIEHQKSRSECGLYSLFYIRSRLENMPYTFFTKYVIPDELMFQFRSHVFRSSKH